MRLFAPALAFVDVETTGMGAHADAITEIAIVRVDAPPDGGDLRVRAFSSLVNPGMPIPPEIQAMTRITDGMVRDAPRFADISRTVTTFLHDALFVAHNARFDYAFIKHAFARLGERFSARVLCTVKLSRRLFPDAQAHGLDAVIARHGLRCPDRHRALSDASVLWDFVQVLYREHEVDTIESCVRRVLRTPSLPAHLPANVLDDIPEAPGVYLFYGDNALPLYIGKSRNLRERVGAHFSSDHRSSTDLRLSSEIRRIEHHETAGEFGALVREAALVKRLMPAHNHALRRKRDAGVIDLGCDHVPRFVRVDALDPAELTGHYGPFASRRHARETLLDLAREHRLCAKALGLEHRTGPCFARQIERCAGWCVGQESALEHATRLREALGPWTIPPWPFPGMAVLYEHGEFGERVDAHVLRDWCWLGTARDQSELARLIDTPPAPELDIDIARLIIKTIRRGTRMHAVTAPETSGAA